MSDNLHQGVIETIEFIKKVHSLNNGNPMDVFRNGNCGNVYTFLKQEFSEQAESYGVCEFGGLLHIVTKIDEKYYDISGEVTLENYIKYLLESEYNEFSRCISDYSIRPVSEEEVENFSNNYKAVVSMKNFDRKTAVKTTPSPEDDNMRKIKEALELRKQKQDETEVALKQRIDSKEMQQSGTDR